MPIEEIELTQILRSSMGMDCNYYVLCTLHLDYNGTFSTDKTTCRPIT